MEPSENEILKLVPTINQRNYWYVRTNSGIYLPYFKEKGIIAIGYNRINPIDIKSALIAERAGTMKANDYLKQKITERYGDEIKRTGVASNNILNFSQKIRKGDIVISPSYAADYLSIGLVLDNILYHEKSLPNDEEIENCPYLKRRKIKWVEQLPIKIFHTDIFVLKYVHNTILNISDFAHHIDNKLHSVYIKNNKVHITLHVKKQNKIASKDLYGFNYEILYLVDRFCLESGLPISTNEIETRISVQSEGLMEHIGDLEPAITYIVILLCFIFGIDISIKLIGAKAKIPGIIPGFTKWLMDRERIKLLKTLNEKAKNMDLKGKDFTNILKEALKEDEEGKQK